MKKEIISNFYTINLFLIRSILIIPGFNYLLKKLFESTVARDFANEKAFNAAQYPFFSKYFYEYAFCKLKYVFLELPF